MQLQIDTILLPHIYASETLFPTDITTINDKFPIGMQIYSTTAVDMFIQTVCKCMNIQCNKELCSEVMSRLLEYYQLGLLSPQLITATSVIGKQSVVCSSGSSSGGNNYHNSTVSGSNNNSTTSCTSTSNSTCSDRSSSLNYSILADFHSYIRKINTDKLAYIKEFRNTTHNSSSSNSGSNNNATTNNIIKYTSYNNHSTNNKLYYKYSIQWLSLLPTLCIQYIHYIDNILKKQQQTGNINIAHLRENLTILQNNQTRSSIFNQIQSNLIKNSIVPADNYMRFWFLYYIKYLYSIEYSIKIIYTAISAHYSINIDYTIYPIISYLKVIEEIIYELYDLVIYSNDNNIIFIIDNYIEKIPNVI